MTPPTLQESWDEPRLGRDSQDGVSQQQQAAPLFFPQLDRLYEANLRGEDASNAVAIPVQHVSRRAEQLRLHTSNT